MSKRLSPPNLRMILRMLVVFAILAASLATAQKTQTVWSSTTTDSVASAAATISATASTSPSSPSSSSVMDNLVLSRISAFIQPMLSTCSSVCQPFVEAVNGCGPATPSTATSMTSNLTQCVCQPSLTVLAQRCAACLTSFDTTGSAYFRAALYDRYLGGCEALGEVVVKSTSVSMRETAHITLPMTSRIKALMTLVLVSCYSMKRDIWTVS